MACSDAAAASSFDDCNGLNPPQGKERHVRDSLAGKIIDEGVIVSVCDIVKILHADDLGYSLTLSQLLGAYATQTEMVNLPVITKLRSH